MVLNRSGLAPPPQDLVMKYVDHFAAISDGGERAGACGTTPTGCTTTGSRTPSGEAVPVKTRLMVGIIPALAAVVVTEG